MPAPAPTPVPAPVALRIYHNPYGTVDWASDLRLKTQHHDHPGVMESRIRAYDEAGYDAIILADYSGAPNRDYALKARLWPPEAVLSPTFLASLRSIKFFIPGAEEVGLTDHYTSPFLTQYVERWLPQYSAQKQASQYDSAAEFAQLVRAAGGLLLLAHPWNSGIDINQYEGVVGTEIYSAFAEARRRAGVQDFVSVDRNALLLESWDRALVQNQALIGIAVNDHFGPLPDLPTDPDVKDSGKIIVLAKAATLPAYRDAFERRAILAVKDKGVQKDRLPAIRSIDVGASSVSIDTEGTVRWIARGTTVGNASTIQYSSLPPGATYLRAEVQSSDGSVVIFTQAFSVRPVGDADGDGDVDTIDQAICANARSGTERESDRIAACSSS